VISQTSSDADSRLKVALPKGGLTKSVACLMERADFVVPGYHDGSRVYRLVSESPPGVFVKVFSPRDIPIQVAVGNYDIGISDRLWVDELITSYRRIALVIVMELGFGHERLYAATAPGSPAAPARPRMSNAPVRIVSEYPNLAEAYARSMRFFNYRVFPVWGAAASYLPEAADIAVVKGANAAAVRRMELEPTAEIVKSQAVVIANRASFETRDLSGILSRLREAS
jgi:ATP phosphoribosyltransferase